MYLTPRQLLLGGATGLTGEYLLDRLLSEPTVQRVLAPSRRPLPEHPRLDNPVGALEYLLPALQGPVETVFCCLGARQQSGSPPPQLEEVDLELVLAFARRARILGARHLLVVSARGASLDSTCPWLQAKGRMEQALQQQGWPQLTIARPPRLLGPRYSQRLLDRLMAPLAGLLPGSPLGLEVCALVWALWRLALEEDQGLRIVEADELRRLGE